ncbi:MAG: CsgG/HfaB family protein [Planctomycetaceae bacterium]
MNRLTTLKTSGTFLVGLCLLSMNSVSNAQESQQLWHRWAILSTPEADQTGLTDLAFAELATRDDIELVERAELKTVLAETELQQIAGAGSSARQEAGKLLSADALLFFGVDQTNDEKYINFWICDCQSGARVRHERIRFVSGSEDSIVKLCSENVESVRRQYPEGVQGIVAVPPFLSQNLEQDRNHLSVSYARLLQNAVMAKAGLAVIEMEEVDAIGQELAAAGGTIEPGRVPLVVRGRYETKPDGIFVELKALRGDKEQLSIAEVIPPETVGEALAGRLADSVIKSINDSPATEISSDDLFEQLVQRADTLARYASYQESVAVREAALLMQPDNIDQRLLIIRDLMEWRRSPAGSPAWYSVTDEERKQIAVVQVDSLRTACRELEYLMRNRMLSPREAAWPWMWILNNYPWNHPSERAIAREYFLALSPLFQSLDHTIRDGSYHEALLQFPGVGPVDRDAPAFRSRAAQDDLWIRPSLRYLLDPELTENVPPIDIPTVVKFFETSVPFEVPSAKVVSSFLTNLPKDDETQAQRRVWLQELFGALAAGKNPTHQFYGHCGQLGLRLSKKDAIRESESLLKDLAALEEFTTKFTPATPGNASGLSPDIQSLFNDIRNRLAPQTLPPLTAKQHTLPENPNPRISADSRITFERLPIDGRWLGIRKCGDNLDVLWNASEAAFLDPTGKLRGITKLNPAAEILLDIQWDGEVIWVVTNRRIAVVAPDGMALAELIPDQSQGAAPGNDANGTDSIPNWFEPESAMRVTVTFARNGRLQANMTPPVQIQPIAPGRVLAWGQNGRLKRVWIADLRLQKEEHKIAASVFHTGIEQNSSTSPAADPSRLVFDPVWSSLVNKDGHQQLLIGRGNLDPRQPQLSPIAIDPEQLKVTLPELGDAPTLRSERFPYDGGFFYLNPAGTFTFAKKGEKDAWETKPVPVNVNQMRSKYPGFLQDNDRIYSPGPYWHEIDAVNQKVQVLNESAVDPQFHFSYFAESASLGLVGWHRGDALYRIRISDTPQRQPLYEFVPEIRRTEHVNAIHEIEKFGGIIGARFTSLKLAYTSDTEPDWHTIVMLPETWSGGDDALALLKDLHNLSSVIAVKAPITDAGTPFLSGIPTLKFLSLVETEITDEGTDFLKHCPELIYLRLEGSLNGHEFSDRSLQHLRDLKNLKQLVLYGRGFTNDGLNTLSRRNPLQRLVSLHLLDTTVTKEGLVDVALNTVIGKLPADPLENLSQYSAAIAPSDKATVSSATASTQTSTEVQDESDPQADSSSGIRIWIAATAASLALLFVISRKLL